MCTLPLAHLLALVHLLLLPFLLFLPPPLPSLPLQLVLAAVVGAVFGTGTVVVPPSLLILLLLLWLHIVTCKSGLHPGFLIQTSVDERSSYPDLST